MRSTQRFLCPHAFFVRPGQRSRGPSDDRDKNKHEGHSEDRRSESCPIEARTMAFDLKPPSYQGCENDEGKKAS